MEKEKEILRKQLELLAEYSVKYKNSANDLAQYTLSMCKIYELLVTKS